MNMSWIVIAAIGLAVLFVLIRYFFGSAEDYGELNDGLTRIQKNAFDHITAEEPEEGISPARMDFLDKVSFQTSNRFSVVYTISVQDKDKYLHTVSGKPLKKRPRKAVIENMLFLMTVLSSQFEQAKFGEDVKFGIDESELGTMYIEFFLDEKQQDVFETVVFGKRRPRKTPKPDKPDKSDKLRAQCPKCNAVYKVDRAKIPDKGAYTRCKRCKERFIVRKQ